MCGITCIISSNQNLENKIQVMTDSLYHRGPDSSNIWVSSDNKVALGHRRLAILDLTNSSKQPMTLRSGKAVTMVYNGEIYNFLDIKKELIELGHKIETTGDTEILLKAYIQWGEKVVHKLNGMWAFVIYDHLENKVFISRDRVGMKPLYIFNDGKNIVLASEIKGILKSGFVKAEVDKEGLVEYFSFQNIISNKTLFRNINTIPAGYNAVYDINKKQFSQYQYWDYNFKTDDSVSIDDHINEFQHVFGNALDRHLISDVDIGATLSGGMDSSSIVSLAAKKIDRLNTFTGFFDTRFIAKEDRCHSEHEDARRIADLYSTEHYEKLISSGDVITTLPKIIWHLEDPKVAMCYTFYLVSQKLSQKVKVNLSGTGGDELFGGYPWRYSLIDQVTCGDEFNNIYYNYWCRLLKDNQRENFFLNKVGNRTDFNRPREVFTNLLKDKQDLTKINQAFYFELKTFLDGMLMVEDKMGMAFSVETRFPFLDKEVIDFALKIPSNMKYENGEAKSFLKKAMQPFLPEETIYKRKQGFTPPDMTWYKKNLRYYIENLLLGKKSLLSEYINRDEIKNILNRHNLGLSDERMIIWSMMYFEGWLRVFIDNNSVLSREF